MNAVHTINENGFSSFLRSKHYHQHTHEHNLNISPPVSNKLSKSNNNLSLTLTKVFYYFILFNRNLINGVQHILEYLG